LTEAAKGGRAIASPDLTTFGEIYTVNEGSRYIRIGAASIRTDACKPFRGVVEQFGRDCHAGWSWVKVQGEDKLLFLHNNWVKDQGELSPADRVEGIIDVFSNGFWFLRKVPVEEVGANV
jgi:hypothetical protein